MKLQIYDRYLYEGELFANQLCVSNENVSLNDFEVASSLHAAALFGVDQKKVFLSEHMHDRLFPASTTKILTLYLALKYGTLSDEVTVSKNAVSVPSDSSVAGLREGEQLTLEDLLYGLMLPSGNDSAVAIAGTYFLAARCVCTVDESGSKCIGGYKFTFCESAWLS